MRLWIGRILLLSAFSLLLAHNLVAHVHHHDADAAHHHHGDEEEPGNDYFVFGQLDHSFTGSFYHVTLTKQVVADVVLPQTIIPVSEKTVWLMPAFRARPPDEPLRSRYECAVGLRGPPIA